ncbi:MAG TPA: hypothetical protein VKC57_05095 [Ktedonobacterales bacterium]|nr:hypothetical protein [Ktedonobacterales bacterium]
MAASLVTGDVAQRALAIVRARLATLSKADGVAGERKRLARDLAEAEHDKANLARAIAKRGDLDALLVALDEATRRAAAVRNRLARLEAEPKRLDPRRALANIESKLAKLGENLDARAVLAAALRRRRLTATPVEVNGQRRWQLSAKIDAGYLLMLPNSGAPSTRISSGCGGCVLWESSAA